MAEAVLEAPTDEAKALEAGPLLPTAQQRPRRMLPP